MPCIRREIVSCECDWCGCVEQVEHPATASQLPQLPPRWALYPELPLEALLCPRCNDRYFKMVERLRAQLGAQRGRVHG